MVKVIRAIFERRGAETLREARRALRLSVSAFIISVLIIACNGNEQPKSETPVSEVPEKVQPPPAAPLINADSAYAFVQKQVDFGPRIPGTKQHAACADWLQAKL